MDSEIVIKTIILVVCECCAANTMMDHRINSVVYVLRWTYENPTEH